MSDVVEKQPLTEDYLFRLVFPVVYLFFHLFPLKP